jgi:hypothetical protein
MRFAPIAEARTITVEGTDHDLIALVGTFHQMSEAQQGEWIAPAAAGDVKLGEIAYVHSYGDMRRGVVTKIGRTKITVTFTTAGARDNAMRYAEEGLKVTAKAEQLVHVRVHRPTTPAPVADVEQAAPVAEVEYASPGAQLDAALAKHTAAVEQATPALPEVEPADPAAEASLDAKLAAADVAEPREIQRATGTVRDPQKFLDLTGAEINALRGRPAPEAGPMLAVIAHPRSMNAIVVGPFESAEDAAAWWAPEFNRMRAESMLFILVPVPVAELPVDVDGRPIPVGVLVECVGAETAVLTGTRGRIAEASVEAGGPGRVVIEWPNRPTWSSTARSANRVRVIDPLTMGRATIGHRNTDVHAYDGHTFEAGCGYRNTAEARLVQLLDDSTPITCPEVGCAPHAEAGDTLTAAESALIEQAQGEALDGLTFDVEGGLDDLRGRAAARAARLAELAGAAQLVDTHGEVWYRDEEALDDLYRCSGHEGPPLALGTLDDMLGPLRAAPDDQGPAGT